MDRRQIGCWSLVIGGLLLLVFGGRWMLLTMLHTDDHFYPSVMSPDGRIVALAQYHTTPSNGYYRIILRRRSPDGSLTPWENALEYPEENFAKLQWKDSKTLEVHYNLNKHNDPFEDTPYGQRPAKWHEINIEYVPTIPK